MKNKMCGKGMDRMPNIAFRMMALVFKIRDKFVSLDKLLNEFNITKGQTIVDYGCGPGSYISKASELVGPEGRVFAVDIHELAIEAIKNAGIKFQVCPFETVMEGEYDELMNIVKDVEKSCFNAGAQELIVNLKIHLAKDSDIHFEDKTLKYQS